jgi:hypothetical protein
MVSVELAPDITDGGLKVTLALDPEGKPAAPKNTSWGAPLTVAVFATREAELPAVTASAVELRLRLKSFGFCPVATEK